MYLKRESENIIWFIINVYKEICFRVQGIYYLFIYIFGLILVIGVQKNLYKMSVIISFMS